MKRLIAIVVAAVAAFFVPGTAWAGGSDSPTPYTVTSEGISFPAPLAAHGHVNVRTDGGSFGLHFDPNNGHPGAAWIGESFLPWSALGISEGCVVWVQWSDSNSHFGEGGQEPVCLTPEPELSPEPEPEPEPSEEPSEPEPEPSEPETPTAPETDGEETSTPTPAPNPDPGGTPSPGPDPTPVESVPASEPEPTRPTPELDSADPGVSQEQVEECPLTDDGMPVSPRGCDWPAEICNWDNCTGVEPPTDQPIIEIGTPQVTEREQPEPSPTSEVATSSVDSPALAATGINNRQAALIFIAALLITIGILLIQKGLKK